MPKKIYKSSAKSGKKRQWILGSVWFASGITMGLFVPWLFYLNSLINSHFIEHQWTVPSLVYARDLQLYQGKNLSEKQLLFELGLLNYKKVKSPSRPGEYDSYKNRYEIYSKGFHFADGKESPKKIFLEIQNNQIVSIQPQVARLEPAIIGQFYSKDFRNSQPVSLHQLPDTLVKGLQAIEDREFKHHQGVDVFGVLRAAIKNLMAGKIVQGGSTITQQLVKNRFQYSEKRWVRKVNEALTAMLLENKWDKGQILESYFNEIYWGQSGSYAIHGIQAASQYYFAKRPQQLTIDEQALLIGIVKGPSWYDPVRQKQRSLQRRNLVLGVWLETGVISRSQWELARIKPLNAKKNKSIANRNYGDYLDLVQLQLQKQFSQNQLQVQGLKVFTHLNPYVYKSLSSALQKRTLGLGENLQAAATVVDPVKGHLIAIKGSSDSITYYNRAIHSKRQIGSLIKPFVFLAALTKLPDFSMQTRLNDTPIEMTTEDGKLWAPKNYDQQSMGSITAQQALYMSRNQATVQLGLQLGVNEFIQFLNSIGLQINHSTHPSIFLGSTELSVLEVSHLYLILASHSRQQFVESVKYVTDNQNRLIGQPASHSQLQLPKEDLQSIQLALNEVILQGTGRGLRHFHKPSNPLFGKTGTTNSGKNSWFVGYNKNYLGVFWVGRDDNKATTLTGSNGAMQLWKHWYQEIIE